MLKSLNNQKLKIRKKKKKKERGKVMYKNKL